MVTKSYFYTYAYLRVNRTPYYIGKGSNGRAFTKHKNVPVPKDKSRIIFLKVNLTEEDAFKHEIYMISVFGRKDLGTGILLNRTNGGDNPPSQKGKPAWNRGIPRTEEQKKSHSEKMKGKKAPNAKLVKIFGKTYSSIKKACKDNNIAYSQYVFQLNSDLSFKTPDELKRHIWDQRATKISKAKKGKPSTSKGMTGKTHSEESRKKMSEARWGCSWLVTKINSGRTRNIL